MAERHGAVLILESLLEGIPVEIGGDTFALSEDERTIVTRGKRLDLGTGITEECWLNTFQGLGMLMKLAKAMTNEERFLIGANLVLNQRKQNPFG